MSNAPQSPPSREAIELSLPSDEPAATTPPPGSSSPIDPPSPPPRLLLKLLSSGFSFFVAGTNDGSLGALMPYILQTYSISTSLIAILYATTFTGWLLCALSNSHAAAHLPRGTLLALGAALQLFAHALRAPAPPPFGLFALAFGLAGLGAAYQDAHANTFVSGVAGAHRWLAFIHAMYGLGCLVAPFVASELAAAGRWTWFYGFPAGLGLLNLGLVLVAFWEEVGWRKRGGEREEERSVRMRNRRVMSEVKQMLKLKDLWLLSLFFFFYLGAAATSGGWAVIYLIQIRHDAVTTAGYLPTGFYGGLFLGRLLLAEPTHRFGERRMLFLYALCCLTFQLTFWLVPSLVASVVAFTLMGFFLGPFFAAGISVASKLLLLPAEIQPTALAFIFLLAQAGAALCPALTGLVARRAGVQALQPVAVALLVAMAACWVAVPGLGPGSGRAR